MPAGQNDQGNPVTSRKVGFGIGIWVRMPPGSQLAEDLRQVVTKLGSGWDQRRLWDTIFTQKIVRATTVAVENHKQQCLKPHQAIRHRPHRCGLTSGIRQDKALGFVERGHLLKSVCDTIFFSGCHGVQSVQKHLLGFTGTLMQEIKQTPFGVR